MGRSILLWMLGVPIPIIIRLALYLTLRFSSLLKGFNPRGAV